MSKHIVIFSVISSVCLSLYSHTLEEALAILSNAQLLKQIKVQAYNSLTPHEQRTLMPDNYFAQTAQNRAILAKLAHTIIALAHQQNLFTIANEQEYTRLRTVYIQQVIALREARLSLKLRIIASMLSEDEKQALQKQEYLNNSQQAYTILEQLAERVYTEIILPKTADKDFYINQEFFTLDKQVYKTAFVAEKIKELNKAYLC